MCEDEGLEELNIMAKEIVSVYKIVRAEVERQFPTLQAQEHQQICSSIAPFINNMFATAFNEYLKEDLAKTSVKRKKKR
jgi:phage terminase Nu1 subunit (DNA packaging protein)